MAQRLGSRERGFLSGPSPGTLILGQRFEAVHGTAPKYAGMDVANACPLILSRAVLLEHLSLDADASLVIRGVEKILMEGMMTQAISKSTSGMRYLARMSFQKNPMEMIAPIARKALVVLGSIGLLL